MRFLIKRTSTQDIDGIVAVINESSHGFSFQFRVDRTTFLALSRFWNFSYQHSYIGYHDSQAGGVIINSVDHGAREGYSFYWGVLPQFRRGGLGLALYNAYLDQAAGEGFASTYGDTSLDSPHSIFRRLGYETQQELVQMRGSVPSSYFSQQDSNEPPVRGIHPEEFFEALGRSQSSRHCWMQRPRALRKAAPFLRFVKSGNTYAAYLPYPQGSMVMDCIWDHPAERPVLALLSHIATHSGGGLCQFFAVPVRSALHGLLTELGFTVTNRSEAMVLDLQHWRGQSRGVVSGQTLQPHRADAPTTNW